MIFELQNVYYKTVKNECLIIKNDCLVTLKEIPDKSTRLVVTSPPYNIGKEYEKKMEIEEYVAWQSKIIKECIRIVKDDGSICWQIGNYVNSGFIIPLDIIFYNIFSNMGMHLCNRIIWSFNHGLHCKNRFSGRYETILWFVKDKRYVFNLDPVRIPQKYPNKRYFKGEKKGQLSCNPLGKNPGDVWDNIPNVKHNHVEKTIHPCQFPVELVERLVLSMSNKNDIIVDPFCGAGSSLIASLRNNRISIGIEIEEKYCKVSKERISKFLSGDLKTRKMNTKIHTSNDKNGNLPQIFT